MDIPKIYSLLPEFRKKFLYGKNVRCQIQKKPKSTQTLGYYPKQLTDSSLIEHFSQKLKETSKEIQGSLGVYGKFEDNQIRWVAIDADNAQETNDVLNKIIPAYQKLGIDYILEHARKDRCKVWTFFNTTHDYAYLITKQILEECKAEIKEIFPLKGGIGKSISKDNNLVRIPVGYHITSGEVHPIEYQGQVSSDPIFFIESVINIEALTTEKIKSLLKDIPPEGQPKHKSKAFNRKKFKYVPRNLKLPMKLPQTIEKVASNCQAINTVITKIIDDEKLIDQKGGDVHNAGLYIGGLATYNDILRDTTSGKEWFEYLVENYRFRPASSHSWIKDKNKVKEPNRLMAGCEKWKEVGFCEGCPFANRSDFKNPREFIFGTQIKRKKIKDTNLVTVQDVHEKTFNKLRLRIHRLLSQKDKPEKPRDLLLASAQGLGKSDWVSKMAANLSKLDYKVLIAVPTGDLALEHQYRIKERYGANAHILMSHENIFNHKEELKLDFDCPKNTEIQEYVKLGLSSGNIKKKFCKTCPFFDKCPYPEQYSKSKIEESNILIIQHMHFSAKEALYQFIKHDSGELAYDILFIDEGFLDSLMTTIKPSELELEALKTFDDFPWTKSLFNWLTFGGYPDGTIQPSFDHRKQLKTFFDANSIPWNIPDYIRSFNSRYYYDKNTEMFIFHELPNIPIRVFTDATPPREMLETVLDNKHIEPFGEEEILNIKVYNPKNEVIQVLDSSLSKSALEKNESDKLYLILNFIGDKATNEFKTEKILLTLYQKHEDEARLWLLKNYPNIVDRIFINYLSVGTNAYKDFDVQFLLAGVYPKGNDLIRGEYELNTIANWWNKKNGRQLKSIPYPYYLSEQRIYSVPFIQEPVIKIEPDGIYEYSDCYVYPPENTLQRLIYKHRVAKTQQAIRLRFFDLFNMEQQFNKKTVYIFGNYNFPSLLITKVTQLDELIGYLTRS